MKINNDEQHDKEFNKPIKDYLYLNMDFLETSIAQIDGGYKALQISDDTREAKELSRNNLQCYLSFSPGALAKN